MIYAAVLALCAVSFFLPGIVLDIRDRALARTGETVPADEIQLSLLSDLSSPQMLALVGDQATTTVPLTSGRHFTEEDASEVSDSIVRAMSLLDKGVSSFDLTLRPELRVGPDDSALLTWTAVYTSDSRDVTVVFDDENGSCLGFRQISYPHGKDAFTGVDITASDGGAESSTEDPASDVVIGPNGVYDVYEYYNEKGESVRPLDSVVSGYTTLIYKVLEPLGVSCSDVSVSSPESVSAIIPYDNTYYSMPVTVRMRETDDGLDYSMMISVNM